MPPAAEHQINGCRHDEGERPIIALVLQTTPGSLLFQLHSGNWSIKSASKRGATKSTRSEVLKIGSRTAFLLSFFSFFSFKT